MRIHAPKDWELAESAVTPEAIYAARDRRSFLKAAGLGLAGAVLLGRKALGATAGFPASVNPAYPAGSLKVTPYNLITSYNNFYEFGMDKGDPVENANKGWKTEPWTIEIGGLAGNPGKWDVDDLIGKLGGIEQARLSPPLRRGLVDGHSLERICAGEARRFRPAEGGGQVRAFHLVFGPRTERVNGKSVPLHILGTPRDKFIPFTPGPWTPLVFGVPKLLYTIALLAREPHHTGTRPATW